MRLPYADKTSFGEWVFEDNDVIVESIDEPTPEIRTDKYEKVGGHGSTLRSLTFGEREITLACRVNKPTWDEFDAVHDQMNKLVLGGEQRLVLRTHSDQYYNAHISSVEVGERLGGTGIGELNIVLTACDPFRRSLDGPRTIPFASTTIAVTRIIEIIGTYRPELVIETGSAHAVGTTSGGTTGRPYRWGFTSGDGGTCYVDVGTDESRYVRIDGRAHVAVVGTTEANATATGMLLSSEWFEPEGDASGMFTLTKPSTYGKTYNSDDTFVHVYDRWV